MVKKRIYKLAKELGISSERVIKIEDGKITEDYYLKDINTLLNSMGYER